MSCNITASERDNTESVASTMIVSVMVMVSMMVAMTMSAPITPEIVDGTAEVARQSWNNWQEFERENLPWLYRCAGPIGIKSKQIQIRFQRGIPGKHMCSGKFFPALRESREPRERTLLSE